MAKNKPNIQNIPIRTEVGRKIKAAFIEESTLTVVDYSKIEERILTHMANKRGT